MDTYKQICAKLVEAWDSTAGGEYEDFGRAASYLVDWTRAALAEPEPEGPTDEELRQLRRENGWPLPELLIFSIARAVLARWGNHPASPDSSTQPS